MSLNVAETPSPHKSPASISVKSSSPVKTSCRALLGLAGSDSPIKKSNPLTLPSLPCNTSGLSSPSKLTRTTSLGGVAVNLLREQAQTWLASGDDTLGNLAVSGLRCRTLSNISGASETALGRRGRTASNFSNISSPQKSSPQKLRSHCFPRPLPQADVDWLMSTLSAEDCAKFDRKFFLNDCERRFHELDTDGSGLLGIQKLQGALPDMFPTLNLELKVDGHHIPALDQSIPRLIATFDADSDGFLDFQDFIKFMKFQLAWRCQFYLNKVLPPTQARAAESGSMSRSSSLPNMASSCRSQCGPVGRLSSSGGKRRRSIGGNKSQLTLPKQIPSRPSSNASSISTRCPSSASQSRDPLDPSRGSFYSSMYGLSLTS